MVRDRSDDDVVVKPGVVQLDGGYMPVNFGSVSIDDRRSDEPILEHISCALQEAIGESSGAAWAGVSPANEPALIQSSHVGLALRVFIALVLTVGFVIALAWYSYGSEVVRWTPQVSLGKPQDPAPSSRAATANENVPQEARAKGASTATDMAEWLQTAARDASNVEQAIQQLKASQEQMVRDNAELAERLRATEERLARTDAAVAERLTATEAQIARDNAQNVEQLKAAQSQMAHDNAALSSELKAGLEQMTGAIAKATEKPTQRASEQNPRPKPSRQIVTGSIRRAVRAPQLRAP